jgi:hypothetical protein
MPGPDFDLIAEAITPEGLAEVAGAVRVGNAWRCPDPDHPDNNPSWSPYRQDGRTLATCHSRCGTHTATQWVAVGRGVSEPEAARLLAARAGISLNGGGRPPPPGDPTPANEALIAEEQARREAREGAQELWESAIPAPPDHPYLARKGVGAHGIRQGPDGLLLVPVWSPDGKLQSIQRIWGRGKKRFLEGTSPKGGFLWIGDPVPSRIAAIVEGFATGASVHESTGLPVAVAFGADNLRAVAEAVRETDPSKVLVLAADGDDPSRKA